MKKEKNKDFTKLTREGVSLIVLIITIIVVIILAAVVILTISKNNPLKSAKEATFKEDVRNFQSDLLLTISKQYTENQGNRDLKINTQSIPATFDEMKTYIPNYTKKYDKKLGIEDDEIVYFPDEVTADEKKWLEDLGIKPWGKDIEEASVDIFRWDPNDDTKIIGYNAEPLKEYLLRNKNVLRIPEKCKSIEKYSFQNCDSLVKVIIPDSVKSIGQDAFENTPWYESKEDGVVYINNILYKYKGDMPINTSITIKSGTKSITNAAFCWCDNLIDITIPNSITSIGDSVFHGCSGLTNITIPNSVVRIGDTAFYGCSSLISITIPDSVTYINWIAFSNCTSLTNVTLSKNIQIIEKYMFEKCTSLTNIIIPDGVTKILHHAFNECSSLTTVTIPNSVKNIAGYSFSNCGNLSNITFDGTKNEWNNITKESNWNDSSNIQTITCADGIINL